MLIVTCKMCNSIIQFRTVLFQFLLNVHLRLSDGTFCTVPTLKFWLETWISWCAWLLPQFFFHSLFKNRVAVTVFFFSPAQWVHSIAAYGMAQTTFDAVCISQFVPYIGVKIHGSSGSERESGRKTLDQNHYGFLDNFSLLRFVFRVYFANARSLARLSFVLCAARFFCLVSLIVFILMCCCLRFFSAILVFDCVLFAAVKSDSVEQQHIFVGFDA